MNKLITAAFLLAVFQPLQFASAADGPSRLQRKLASLQRKIERGEQQLNRKREAFRALVRRIEGNPALFPTGDLNGDGVVSEGDAKVLGSFFGQSGRVFVTSSCGRVADLNGDGSVDIVDFGILSSNVTVPGTALPIPE